MYGNSTVLQIAAVKTLTDSSIIGWVGQISGVIPISTSAHNNYSQSAEG